MLVSREMRPPRRLNLSLLAGALCTLVAHGQAPPLRYRVEQILRLETTSAQAQPVPGRLRADPTTAAVEGRVRFILEQRFLEKGRGVWRFTRVEVEGPRAEPVGSSTPGVERALALGLAWMKELDGQEFNGPLADLPVLPVGEAAPPWLTDWLRWAQTGSFAGVEANPVERVGATNPKSPPAAYDVQWLRSESRLPHAGLCHVQQARWVVSVEEAPGSVPVNLAEQGVEARTHFSAQSLEWVAQDEPTLIYAERSGVRETFWTLEKVKAPELRDLVFRLRFAVEVRVERLP